MKMTEDSKVLMFGVMGGAAGMSTFANTLLEREQYEEGDGAESITGNIQVA